MQRVTALFLSLLCLLTAAAAPKWSADVFMLNGTEHRGVPVAKLPEGWDKQIKTVVDNKKMSIPSDSISSVVLWRNDNPDDKCLIAWLPFGEFIMGDGSYKQTMNKKQEARKWFAFDTKGENLALWINFSKLKSSKSGFTMQVGNFPYWFETKAAPYLIGVERNVFKPSLTRRWLSAFLADDEVLVDEINAEKELNRNLLQQQNLDSPLVFRRIAETYTPSRKR